MLLLNGDMGHGGGWCGTMPMLLTRRKPHHIARFDLLDRAALTLRPAAARRDDQRLAERVSVPCRTRTRLKGHTCATCAGWVVGRKQRIKANLASEILRDTCCDGREPLRIMSIDRSPYCYTIQPGGSVAPGWYVGTGSR